MVKRWTAQIVALGAASLLCLLAVADAQAGDRVYWGELGKIVFSDSDSPGGVQTLQTGGVTVHLVEGTAIDPVTERIYWVDRIENNPGRKVLFANLDGSGGGELNLGTASNVESTGLAIDPVGRTIYWADRSADRIGFARLDGSGGGTLSFAKLDFPGGVAIDPVARRIYWVNAGGPAANTVSFANLDGPGEGSLAIGTAEENDPHGAAIDPVNHRIYWANLNGTHISYANFDGSGGGNLNTAGAPVGAPAGVAVDPVGGRVYWANRGGANGGIFFANLDGSGAGGALVTNRFESPQSPQLHFSPKSVAPPAISGGSAPGSQLSCSIGNWATDAYEAFFFSSPRRFDYQWSRNGADIPGATQPTLTTELAGGEYRCRVTAANTIGATSRTSAPHLVAPQGGSLTLRLASAKIRAGGPLRVEIANIGETRVTGSLSAQAKAPAPSGRSRVIAVKGKAFELAAHARTVVGLRLPKPLQLQLLRRHKLQVALSATFGVPPSGPKQVTGRSVMPRLLVKR